ncbi:MAG: A/G-specific adenine glycosylase [Trichloromonadaceae bacterium]
MQESPLRNPFDPAAVAPLLLAWYGRCGRDLPWRHSRDPYRIWLSEIMLQQTTVAAVIPYFQRFLQHFPDVVTLAAAPVEAVIAQWAGLGYYSRARNLHAAAQQVMGEHGGVFPPDLEALQRLPGVGRSTAGAIYSIAFDRPGPILDANVRRVLCRLFALDGDPRSSSAERQLWRWATALTPAQNCHDYAQASMDLGATVCTPSAPVCLACPLETLCQARRLGLEGELPRARPKKAIPTQTQVALLLGRQGTFLVRRRPLSGMLGGLWEFPGREVGAGETPAAAARDLLRQLGLEGELLPAGGVRHAYSHFKLDLKLFRVSLAGAAVCAEGDQSSWLTPAELGTLALHGAHQKALSLLPAACSEPGGANLFQE